MPAIYAGPCEVSSEDRSLTGSINLNRPLIRFSIFNGGFLPLSEEPVMSAQFILREYDRKRCECRTSSGKRCQHKTQYIIRGQNAASDVAEYGSCGHHWLDFTVLEVRP